MSKIDFEPLAKMSHMPAWVFEVPAGRPLIKLPAITVEEARNMYSEAEHGSEEKASALAKWENLSMIQAKLSSSINRLIEVCKNSPPNGNAQNFALEKVVVLDTNFHQLAERMELPVWRLEIATGRPLIECSASSEKEARWMLSAAANDGEREASILDKWESISLIRIKAAETMEELINAHNDAPRQGEARELAHKKMAELFIKENS